MPYGLPSWGSATTDEILAELGDRLHRYRLQQNRTLADVAAGAGVNMRTAQRARATPLARPAR